MFDTHYPFQYIQSTTSEFEQFECEHLYTFKGKGNHRYLIRVEEYTHYLHALKFHLKAHSDSPNKYNLVTNYNDMTACVRTCINVMLEIYKNNPYASFSFIGANSIDEPKARTKRFNIYERLMKNFFSDVHFTHLIVEKESLYLLLNNNDKSKHPSIIEMIKGLFEE